MRSSKGHSAVLAATVTSLTLIVTAVAWLSPAAAVRPSGNVGQAAPQSGASDSPTHRTSPGLAYDPVREQVVLFGGSDCTDDPCQDSNDTWVWDGTAWTRLDTPTAPSPRRGAAMAWDEAHQVIVLFGGWSESGDQGDTWIWDGSQWTQLHPAIAPDPRGGSGMAYDGVRGEILLFGGFGPYFDRHDTWTWDGSTWRKKHPTRTPPGRFHMGLVFDPLHENVVLFGGHQIDLEGEYSLNDTWTWDGSTWTLRHPVRHPPASYGDAMVYDSATGVVTLFVGTTWFWNGSKWHLIESEQTPGFTVVMRMAYDASRERAVLFGGGFARCDGFGDTWTWAPGEWRLETPPPCPDKRESPGMAYDFARQETVVFGGDSECKYCDGYLDDTWTWDGSIWGHREPTASPLQRTDAGMAYDAARKQVVIFGGVGCSPIRCVDTLAGTGVWDGTTWSRPNLTREPPARGSPSMAFDGARNLIVMFGGSLKTGGLTNQTWTWDGATWALLQPPASPPAMSDAPMAYDAARNQVVLFGADGSTWTWDGATWTQQFPADAPSPGDSAVAYDAARRQVVLFGGGSHGETWTWDGVNWTQLSPAISPTPRSGAGLAFDAARRQVVLFGGKSTSGGDYLADTWVWDGATWTQVGPPSATQGPLTRSSRAPPA